MYILSLVLVVVGSLCYHLSNRAVNRQLPPAFALIVTYATALVIVTAWSFVAGEPQRGGATWRQVNWPTFTLAAGVVLIEAGFLLAYRNGWKLSTASLVANVGSSLLLVVIGATAYGERMPGPRLAGVALAVAGLILINYRG